MPLGAKLVGGPGGKSSRSAAWASGPVALALALLFIQVAGGEPSQQQQRPTSNELSQVINQAASFKSLVKCQQRPCRGADVNGLGLVRRLAGADCSAGDGEARDGKLLGGRRAARVALKRLRRRRRKLFICLAARAIVSCEGQPA